MTSPRLTTGRNSQLSICLVVVMRTVVVLPTTYLYRWLLC